MRILHLSSEYPPAPVHGLGRYAHEIAEAMAARGHFVEVFTNSLNGKEHETVRNGVSIKRVHFPPPPKAPVTSAMLLHFNLQLVERVIEERLAGGATGFDVVNAHDWVTVPAAFHICRLLKCPLVTTIHDVVFNKVRHRQFTAEDAYVAGVENWACHASNRVIVLSESVKKEVLEAYHADANRVAVVPGGVGIAPLSESEFDAVSKWRCKVLPPDEDLLLFAGRLEAEKGLFVLLEAVRKLADIRPTGWRLALVGRGELQGAIEHKITELGLRGRVALLGYLLHDELRYAYAAADVLVVPSDYEPFGLVALEGQRVGTPVIVSNAGGLAETIRKTGGGLTFPPGNAAVLSERLNEMLRKPDYRSELGAKGQRNTGRFYDWNVLVQEVERVYEAAQKLPPPSNGALPDWTHPFLKPNALMASNPPGLSEKTNEINPAHRMTEQFELSNLVVFWPNANMPALKPILERLCSSHALKVLNGRIQVVPVSQTSEVKNWSMPLQHPRIAYIQPQNLHALWATAAAVFAPVELASGLLEAEILNAAEIPTVWIGQGQPEHGWCVANIDELYALANKLLCDETLRSVLAPSLRHCIPQWRCQTAERAKPFILHVVSQLVTGGAETTLLELVKGTSNATENAILCLGPCGGPLPNEFRKVGVDIIQPPTIARNEVLQLIAGKSPDIIQLHSMSHVLPWMPIHRHLAEWNIIESEHVVDIGSGHFGRVDHVVCVSNAVRDAHRKYENAWRTHGSEFSVIYNGVDPSDFANLPDKATARVMLKLPLDRLIAGRVSALARNKCTEEAIDCIAEIVKLRNDVLFVIVGDGPQRPDVERWIDARKLQDHVRLLGERRDVPLVLRALDLFAYHTPKEALGNVILEALASGLPVVCSDVEGTREALDGSQGELVPNGNPVAFARAAIRWLDRKDLKPNTLPAKFTRARMCDAYLNLYTLACGCPVRTE